MQTAHTRAFCRPAGAPSRRSGVLPSALLVLAAVLPACHDSREPVAPADAAAFSAGQGDAVDLIVVLEESFARGRGAENRDRAAEFAAGLGLMATHAYGTALFGFAATVPAARVEQLRQHPMVAHVERDRAVSLPNPVFEPRPAGDGGAQSSSGNQVVPWGISRTGARESAYNGSGVHVYVLDTGIDSRHPDLQANIGEGHTVFTSSCKGNPKNCPPPPTWEDDHGHGTHVAGTIGAADNGAGVIGVAPKVTLHAVKVLDSNGSGSWSGIIAGIDWVMEQTVKLGRPTVANMSLGGSNEAGRVGACTASGLTGSSDAMHAALCNARNAGAVFTVSAGNTGGDSGLRRPSAYYDAVMAVSATSCRFGGEDVVQTCESGSEAFTTFSSWGTWTDDEYPSQGSLPVVIAAPGAQVLSALLGGGHRYASGTSMAAPHVAGGAALVLQRLGAAQPADRSAFVAVRSALLGASECTATWHNISGNPHSERFLNLRGSSPIDECVEPGEPPAAPPVAPTELRVVETTTSTATLAWQHVAPGDARFEVWIYRSGQWGHEAYVDGATEYVSEGLNPYSIYYYAVRTVTSTMASAWSNTVEATTKRELVASFSHSCGNSDTCSFTNSSTGDAAGASWNWKFGNGQTSAAYNPQPVTYSAEATYHVSLTVTDPAGRVSTAEATVVCRVRGNRLRCE
jgi:subtilisin